MSFSTNAILYIVETSNKGKILFIYDQDIFKCNKTTPTKKNIGYAVSKDVVFMYIQIKMTSYTLTLTFMIYTISKPVLFHESNINVLKYKSFLKSVALNFKEFKKQA